MFFLKDETIWPALISINLNQKSIDVVLRIHAKAKHYKLSINQNGTPVLTVPPYGKIEKAKEFLFRHQHWLEKKLTSMPEIVPFTDGNIIPLRGEDHLIISIEKIRGRVEIIKHENALALKVPGGEHHIERRLKDWLKKQARVDLEKSVEIHTKNLNVSAKSISVRSQSSRWGSCSSSKNLNFNWRLILAPDYVLDYVSAHEVAHLVEMNHSKAFWAEVKKTLPDMERGKYWLKKNGSQLMRYGV